MTKKTVSICLVATKKELEKIKKLPGVHRLKKLKKLDARHALEQEAAVDEAGQILLAAGMTGTVILFLNNVLK